MDVPLDALSSAAASVPPHRPSAAVEVFKEISYGSVAGMISKVFEHPFDLTKVRLQSQVLDASARFNGPIDCLTKTWRNEGFRGLYRGLPAPVVGAMAENASLFLSYEQFQRLIRKVTHQNGGEQLPLNQLVMAAAGAGAVTSFILTPIELIKCKMQVQMLVPSPSPSSSLSSAPSSHPTHTTPAYTSTSTSTHSPSSVRSTRHTHPGPLTLLLTTIRTNGIRGLWLGHTGTFIRETGGTAAWFGTKEYVVRVLVERRARVEGWGEDVDLTRSEGGRGEGRGKRGRPELRPWESALAGACAGAMFNLVLFPADSVKSAMQTAEELRGSGSSSHSSASSSSSGSKPKSNSPTFTSTFKAMYKAQGIRGLYAGCGITVARSIPSSAIIFLTYDELKKVFG